LASPNKRCVLDILVPHIYTCCMRYFGVEFKLNLVIVNDIVLNLSNLTEMSIVKYGYRE